MGKDYCSITNCHNTKGMIGRFGKPVKLHHLPGEKSLRSAWIRAISRRNYRPNSCYTQVCSDHFPGCNGRTWKHTVPTLFLPQRTIRRLMLEKRLTAVKMPFGTVVLVLKMTTLIVIVPCRRNHCSLKTKYILIQGRKQMFAKKMKMYILIAHRIHHFLLWTS